MNIQIFLESSAHLEMHMNRWWMVVDIEHRDIQTQINTRARVCLYVNGSIDELVIPTSKRRVDALGTNEEQTSVGINVGRRESVS